MSATVLLIDAQFPHNVCNALGACALLGAARGSSHLDAR